MKCEAEGCEAKATGWILGQMLCDRHVAEVIVGMEPPRHEGAAASQLRERVKAAVREVLERPSHSGNGYFSAAERWPAGGDFPLDPDPSELEPIWTIDHTIDSAELADAAIRAVLDAMAEPSGGRVDGDAYLTNCRHASKRPEAEEVWRLMLAAFREENGF